MSLQSKIEEIKHRKLALTEDEVNEKSPHRAVLGVWAECEPGDAPHVAFSVGPLWAQSQRFLDLTPNEARLLARHLIAVADAIDAIVDDHEPSDPPGF